MKSLTQWHCHVNSDDQISCDHSRSSNHNLTPFSECPGTSLMENLAGDQMALQVEMVVDGVVNRQKSLHRSGRFEAAHPSFSAVRWLMRYFTST